MRAYLIVFSLKSTHNTFKFVVVVLLRPLRLTRGDFSSLGRDRGFKAGGGSDGCGGCRSGSGSGSRMDSRGMIIHRGPFI